MAQAMSLVDRPGPDAEAFTDELRCLTGQVPWWGFTGPPGVGKSTLIDALLRPLREKGSRVGVVAVDPTSPMSNGALLGDRVRMMRHSVDQGVFIRSLATHHRDGGLSDATLHCARLLEVAGFDPVLIETVGVGQNEFDVASVADICVVVLGPGYGDDIQLIKAGLLEVADVVVVNKCDLPEANRLLAEVRAELGAPTDDTGSVPRADTKILAVEAKSGKGVDELVACLQALDGEARTEENRRSHRRQVSAGEIRRAAMLRWTALLERGLAQPGTAELMAELDRGDLSMDEVVDRISGGS